MSFIEEKKKLHMYISNKIEDMEKNDLLLMVDLQHTINIQFGFGKSTILKALEFYIDKGIIKYNETDMVIVKLV